MPPAVLHLWTVILQLRWSHKADYDTESTSFTVVACDYDGAVEAAIGAAKKRTDFQVPTDKLSAVTDARIMHVERGQVVDAVAI